MPRPATCSEDELERCVATLAYIVVRHGPVYAPLFDRMERELADMRRRGDPTARARRYLQENSIDARAIEARTIGAHPVEARAVAPPQPSRAARRPAVTRSPAA